MLDFEPSSKYNMYSTPTKHLNNTKAVSSYGKRKLNPCYSSRLLDSYSKYINERNNISGGVFGSISDGKRRIDFSDDQADTVDCLQYKDDVDSKILADRNSKKRFHSESPMASKKDLYQDRYVPSLSASKPLLLPNECEKLNSIKETSADRTENPKSDHEVVSQNALNDILSYELTGMSKGSLLTFKVPRYSYEEDVKKSISLKSWIGGTWQDAIASSPHCTSYRYIPKVPFKILDAPQLQDDFYLNLVDWSSQNIIAVGLGWYVYLWSANTNKVTKLCKMERTDVTSVSWTERGHHVAVGVADGSVRIWDAQSGKRIRRFDNHSDRVGSLSWTGSVLASGSRDRAIYQCDIRDPACYVAKLSGHHRQEVCGLRWSPDGSQLASGGNDNRLLVWSNSTNVSPLLRFDQHKAAVKAIAWSPHQSGLLASGGGTADQCIKFWNTNNGNPLMSVDTGSQVCNLVWSKSINELVSTHGYSLNQVVLWKYPAMSKLCTLTGHTMRVLYLSLAPDGQTIVTGAGDEVLNFPLSAR